MNFLTVLFGACLWDCLLGEPPTRRHPVAFMGKYIAAFWKRRPSGSRRLFFFGTALTISGGALFALPLKGVDLLPGVLGTLVSIPLLKTVFSISALLRAGEEVLDALEREDLQEARRLLSRHLVSRNTEDLSEEETAGAAVESLAENLTDGIASPLFFFALFGLPGAFFFRFCNTCDSMIGYRGGDMEWGGKFAARLDDALNWLPARITALLLLGAAALCGEDASRGTAALAGERNRTASPNAGWTMSAMAGVLGVTLEKRGCYRLFGGTGKAGTETLRRALRLVKAAAAMIIGAAAMLGGLHGLFC